MDAPTRIRTLAADELDFAPAILKLQEAPPSPLPRVILWVLLALVAAALAVVGIRPARHHCGRAGQARAAELLQIVQPADSGIVKELLVKEGDEVKSGQVLVRMDMRVSEADNRAAERTRVRSLQLRRIDAELAGRAFPRQAADPPALFEQVQAQFRARRQAYQDQFDAERAVLAKAQADLKSAIEVESKLNRTLPMHKDQAESWDQLAKEGFAGRLLALDKQRAFIESEQELRAQEYQVASLTASIEQSQKRIAQITSNYRQQLQNERVEAEAQYHRLQQNWDKQQHRHACWNCVRRRMRWSRIWRPTRWAASFDRHHIDDPGAAQRAGAGRGLGVAPGRGIRAAGATGESQTHHLRFPEVRDGRGDGPAHQSRCDRCRRARARTAAAAEQRPNDAVPVIGRWCRWTRPTSRRDGKPIPLTGMQVTAEINLGTRTVLEYVLSPVARAHCTRRAGSASAREKRRRRAPT